MGVRRFVRHGINSTFRGIVVQLWILVLMMMESGVLFLLVTKVTSELIRVNIYSSLDIPRDWIL
jgi:hypothetical protein